MKEGHALSCLFDLFYGFMCALVRTCFVKGGFYEFCWKFSLIITYSAVFTANGGSMGKYLFGRPLRGKPIKECTLFSNCAFQ